MNAPLAPRTLRLTALAVGIACAVFSSSAVLASTTGGRLAQPAQAKHTLNYTLTLRTLVVEGRQRSYYEYAPTNVAALRENDARGLKVVISLHDDHQSAEAAAQRAGWAALAEEKGFIVVFPEAADGQWNLSHDAGRVNDVNFVDGVAAAVRTRFSLTATIPTYLSGVGTGGSMAHEIAMRRPTMSNAVASINGVASAATLALPAGELPPSAMSVWQFNTSLGAYAAAQHSQQLAYWRRANAVNAKSSSKGNGISTTTQFVADNPVQMVRTTTLSGIEAESPQVSRMIWDELFSKVVRFADSKANNGTLHPDRSAADMGLVEQTKTIAGGGGARRWLTYVPPQYEAMVAQGQKLPLLFSFHGRNGSARFQALISKWHEVAAQAGFIVVYPHGLGATWSTGMAADNQDMVFFMDLLEEIKSRYAIDTGRIFLNGSSMGTAFTNRIAVQHPQLFAAIAPCYSGHLSAASYSNALVRTDVPLPVWQCRGAQELDSEFPGSEPAARVFWRETVNRNFGPPTLQVDGRRRTEIWSDGVAEYRWQVTDDIGHFWHPGQAKKMWDEMLSRYRRAPDGSLIRLN
jgi:poly(3-hydroxybutyrate) depolymerase